MKQTNGTFRYDYFLTDHLGNVRVTFTKDANDNAEVLQENHYYPFGMTLGGLDYYSTTYNDYLYQGKELQKDAFDLELNDGIYETQFLWHDFHARFYDAQLGRWHVPDPILNEASPYIGMANNPINMVDPDGMRPGRDDGCRGFGGGMGWYKLGQFFYRIGQGIGSGVGSAADGIGNFIGSIGWSNGSGNYNQGPDPVFSPLQIGSPDPWNSRGGSGGLGGPGGVNNMGGGLFMNYLKMGISEAEYNKRVTISRLLGEIAQAKEKIKNIAYVGIDTEGVTHMLAYFPYEDVLFELQNLHGGSLQAAMAGSSGESKAFGARINGDFFKGKYQYAYEKAVNGETRKNTIWYEIELTNKQAAINYFEGFVNNGDFLYSAPFHTCKHHVLEGLMIGGSTNATFNYFLALPPILTNPFHVPLIYVGNRVEGPKH